MVFHELVLLVHAKTIFTDAIAVTSQSLAREMFRLSYVVVVTYFSFVFQRLGDVFTLFGASDELKGGLTLLDEPRGQLSCPPLHRAFPCPL